MSKHRVVLLKIVAKLLSVSDAATQYGISRRRLHRLLARYRLDGLDALEPRSRRPKTNSAVTPGPVREQIITLRQELTSHGHDAGPVTIAWHLHNEGRRAPSTSTIRRILHQSGLITPQPRKRPNDQTTKRPKSSYLRFEAAQPNEN